MMEGQLILAMMLQRYRLEPVPKLPVEPEALFTLRPRSGVWTRLRKT